MGWAWRVRLGCTMFLRGGRISLPCIAGCVAESGRNYYAPGLGWTFWDVPAKVKPSFHVLRVR